LRSASPHSVGNLSVCLGAAPHILDSPLHLTRLRSTATARLPDVGGQIKRRGESRSELPKPGARCIWMEAISPPWPSRMRQALRKLRPLAGESRKRA
jgi:hypothetical protein